MSDYAPSGVDAAIAGHVPQLIPLKGLRGSIARNLAAAWQAPRVGMAVEVDMSRCAALRSSLEAQAGSTVRITVTHIVLRALALSLRAHPRLNALVRDGNIEVMPSINIGLAVQLEDGLAVPVIRDAYGKSVMQLATESRELADAARAGQLPPKAFQNGTFTLSNLGMSGVDWFTPILNPPQVGIVGVSRVVPRPVVRDDQVIVAPVAVLTLVFDHRAVDGFPAGIFLSDLRKRLETAEFL